MARVDAWAPLRRARLRAALRQCVNDGTATLSELTVSVDAIEAARANAQAIAIELAEAGITVDCLPLLDVAGPATHPAIAERALGDDPMQVAALGRAILDGLSRGGVRLVEGLDLALAPGGALLLTGPNGTGKTTLMRALAGFVRPQKQRLSTIQC